MRAISTVLDVSVFLLLVAAAVGTVTLADPPTETETGVEETTEIVATSTLAVEYEINGSTRRAHGTIGTVLARAAVANATLDGSKLSSSGNFQTRVQSRVEERLVAPNRTQIVAQWVPYRDGPMRGRVVVGPEPPDDADVHSGTLSVPGPVESADPQVPNSSANGYQAVAHPVATAVADGLLPSTRVSASAYRRSSGWQTTTQRYRTIATETGVSIEARLERGAVSFAHGRAIDGLTQLFAQDMARRFDSRRAAARAVRTGRVRIVVRRWNP